MAKHSPFWSDGFYDKGEPSEYSWGSGSVPPCARHAAPDDGGLYSGTSPGMAPDNHGRRHGVPGRQLRA